MAWNKSCWGSKDRKEAANGRRAGDRREALLDQMNEEPSPRHGHRKHKKKKKTFVIQYRYKPRSRGGRYTLGLWGKDWEPWKYYETEKQADDAMVQLTKARDYYEFRKLECE